MQFIKQIKVSEISGILDEYLEKRLKGDKQYFKVAFCAPEAFGKRRNILEWIERNSDHVTLFEEVYPQILYDDVDGILRKNQNGLYCISDSELCNIERAENPVLFYRRINWGRDFKADPDLLKLIEDRRYTNPIENAAEHDLSNAFLTVATSFPEDESTNNTVLRSFDVYEVVATFQETVEYLIEKYRKQRNMMEEEKPYLFDPELDSELRDIYEWDFEYLAELSSKIAILEQVAKRDVRIQHDSFFNPVFIEYALDHAVSEKLSFTEALKEGALTFEKSVGHEELFEELKKIEDI